MKRLAIAAMLMIPTAANAGGIFVPGTGPQAQARAGAFVAKADDPSALYHNPAGFAKLSGWVVYIGSNLVDYSLELKRTGSYEDTGNGESYIGADYPTVEDESTPDLGIGGFQAVPLIAVSTDFGKPELPVRLGFGLMAPQAYPNRQFPVSQDLGGVDPAPGPQRYDVVDQKAVTAMPSIAVAYRVLDKLDLGARFSWGFATLQATSSTWGIRNYEEWEQKDGVFHLDVKDNFVPAFGFGALFRPSSSIELGASYHSNLAVRAKGDGQTELGSAVDPLDPNAFIQPEDREQFIDCEIGGTVDALKSCIDLDLPQMVSIGGRWILRDEQGGERADVELDVRWENWSSERASDFLVRVDGKSSTGGFVLNPVLIRHGLKDVYSVRLGGSYAMPVGPNKLTLRGGVAHDTEAAPLDYNRADFDGAPRTTIAAGIGYDLSKGKYRIDLGGGYVVEPKRTVEQCLPPDGPDLTATACDGTDRPAKDRTRPDPAQPLSDANSAFESPFNAGEYTSGYILLSLGFSAAF